MTLLCAALVLASCSHKASPPAATPTVAPAAPAPKQAEPAPTQLEGAFSYLMVLIDAEPEEGKAPLQVQFAVNRPRDSGQPPVKYHWSFGDGSESTEENPKHTYAKPGSYDVNLEAVDAGGDEDEDELTIAVDGEGEAK